jgi:hypothetical protein
MTSRPRQLRLPPMLGESGTQCAARALEQHAQHMVRLEHGAASRTVVSSVIVIF